MIFFSVIFFILSIFSPIKEVPNKQTVVLIHGFMGNQFNLTPIRYSLKKEGYRVINFSYPSREKNIEDHAADLVAVLNDIASNNKGEPIYFVTHSMGGLVLRAALNNKNCPNEAKIGKVAMLAPPNKGALIARKLYGLKFPRKILGYKAGWQMMVNNNFNYELPKTLKILVASGTFNLNPLLRNEGVSDGVILQKETDLQVDYEKVVVKAGHLGICYSPTVIKSIKKFFNN